MEICKSLNISIGAAMKNPEMLKFIPGHLKTKKKMCKDAVKKLPYLLRYVHESLAALKLIPDGFVTCKMIKKLYIALYTDENILYFNEDSGNVSFCCNEIGILNIDLNNINLDNNFDEDDPDTIILIRLIIRVQQLL